MHKKMIEFRVLVSVEDNGELDEGTVRDGIGMGIGRMVSEGALTTIDDTSTVIDSWNVSHVGTKWM